MEATPQNKDVWETWHTLQQMMHDFWAMLPNYIIALVLFLLFIVLAKRMRMLVRRITHERKSANVGLVLGRIAQWILLLVGFLVAMTIAIPSLTPSDVLSVLGITGVAIGFAFKDILQNFLAGILILLRHPFEIGDQLQFNHYEGTVEQIDTRFTVIRTYDGRKVLIPNGELFISSVIVNTAYGLRRNQVMVKIDLSANSTEASRLILDVMHTVPGVIREPAPDTIAAEMTDSSINILARWWTEASMAQMLSVQHAVLLAIHKVLREAGIPMPTQAISLSRENAA